MPSILASRPVVSPRSRGRSDIAIYSMSMKASVWRSERITHSTWNASVKGLLQRDEHQICPHLVLWWKWRHCLTSRSKTSHARSVGFRSRECEGHIFMIHIIFKPFSDALCALCKQLHSLGFSRFFFCQSEPPKTRFCSGLFYPINSRYWLAITAISSCDPLLWTGVTSSSREGFFLCSN